MNRLELRSYAKINLGLHVLGKRADGFHNLETIFQQVSLFDVITLEEIAAGIEIVSDQPEVPHGPENLCYRAVSLLKERAPKSPGIRVHITKTIPIGAGLGGGSSNAAVTLLGLNVLWDLRLTPAQLRRQALKLGSDVPFFIEGGTARATGRGEVLRPVDLPRRFHCLLVCPTVQISTRWAYQALNFNLTSREKSIKLPRRLKPFPGMSQWQERFPNDCEPVVFRHFPELGEIKRELREGGAFFASLSGSGATVYGLFLDAEAAAIYQKSVGEKYRTFLADPVRWGYEEISGDRSW